MNKFIRKNLFKKLWTQTLGEPGFIQIVTGPRQVGKTTLVLQLFDKWKGPKIYETADSPVIPSHQWIEQHWKNARNLKPGKGKKSLLILDEVQKIPRWSETVKKLYDEDKRMKTNLRIILLGSSSLLIQRGLNESLAGRFELHRHYHWSYKECSDFDNLTLNEYIFFGGFPGALVLRKDENRWMNYIRDSLIETVISKDILLMAPVTKPALLKQVFGLCIHYPSEIVSYQKMIGQLTDAGNTTTIAHYLNLFSGGYLITPILKYSGSIIKQKSSSPKIIVLDNSIISANTAKSFNKAVTRRTYWGRLIENAVGAKLYLLASNCGGNVYYWRERSKEIDFCFKYQDKLIGIEVKSGIMKNDTSVKIFNKRFSPVYNIIISSELEPHKKNDYIHHINFQEFFTDPSIILSF
ncbi:ATP-binding protein [Candidatus Dependentiae bacterium]|nr:ATP-binding protein [Candidatus Dependentiae bacterium]